MTKPATRSRRITKPTSPDNPLEKELSGPQHQRHGHPSHTDVNILTAAEERARRRRKPNSTAKKYDGRSRSKFIQKAHNATSSLPRVTEALTNFYKEIEIPELKQALELSNDPRYAMLLAAINSPHFMTCSFSTLCRKCRLSMQDVVEIWRNHLKTKGLVRMMMRMPDVMEDVVIDSQSRVVTCDLCQGVGKISGKTVNKVVDPICPECHGDGTVRINGDKDARTLAFETVGLKRTGMGVNIMNVNNPQHSSMPTMEEQIASVDKVFDADFTDVTEKETEHGTSGNGADQVRQEDRGSGGEAGGSGESVALVRDTSVTNNRQDGSGFFDPLPTKPDPTDYSA